jgi:hypothetical protein
MWVLVAMALLAVACSQVTTMLRALFECLFLPRFFCVCFPSLG